MTTTRPQFTDGARLTAGQLNTVVEYLRTNLRRLALAPLSPGVGIGLTLAPEPGGEDNLELQVNPGVAVDGRGRILVLSEPRRFRVVAEGSAFALVDAVTGSLWSRFGPRISWWFASRPWSKRPRRTVSARLAGLA